MNRKVIELMKELWDEYEANKHCFAFEPDWVDVESLGQLSFYDNSAFDRIPNDAFNLKLRFEGLLRAIETEVYAINREGSWDATYILRGSVIKTSRVFIWFDWESLEIVVSDNGVSSRYPCEGFYEMWRKYLKGVSSIWYKGAYPLKEDELQCLECCIN